MKQLALDIGLATGPTLERFFAGPNEAALQHLRLAAGAVTWGYATADILRAQRPSAVFETTDDVLREAGLCGA